MANKVITINEDYKIFDKLLTAKKTNPTCGPLGFAKIYLKHKKVHEGSNLVVAKGREFVAQKIFNIFSTESNITRPDYTNYKISHFAIGAGGCSITGTDVTLHGPLIGDTGLYKPISLMSGSGYLNEPSLYQDTSTTPLIYSYKNAVKPINSIYLEEVQYQNSDSYYTKVKCVCNIPVGEPSQMVTGTSVPISEAGLYFVNPALADTDPKKVQLFSHITFPTKFKEKDDGELTIKWYILC